MDKAERGTYASPARTRAKPPLMSLHEHGRLRVGNLMYLLQCSHQTIYLRIKSGGLPQPDGHDPRPYWLTSTLLPLFENKGAL